MTRSPLLSTLIPLIPLAAMAWPLQHVINQEAFQQAPEVEGKSSPTRRADVLIRAAHRFTEVKITIGEASWSFAPDEDHKEIYFPLADSGDLLLAVKATWPENIPESAIFIEFTPDELENRSHTVWGFGEITEEIEFHWDLTP
ncbi:MAG: hypothetical protein QNL33_20195 [Akkermansiaceae bacterium]|jgi:hypothetical protein